MFKRILACLDEQSHDPTLDRAIELASAHNAELTVVRVIDAVPSFIEELSLWSTPVAETARKAALQRLRELTRSRAGKLRVSTDVLCGRPARELARYAQQLGHDLMVKSAEYDESFSGATDGRLLRFSPCPVWIIHPQCATKCRRILVGVAPPPEGSETLQRRVLELATTFAKNQESEIHIAHAWQAHGEQFLDGPMPAEEIAEYKASLLRAAEQRLHNFLTGAGAEFADSHVHFPEGRPAVTIVELARTLGADLVVLGTVSRKGFRGFFLGNTVERVLRNAPCSVLAVKPVGFPTPLGDKQA